MAKILVGLSGGVDSAVSALLLQEAGHEVSGAYIRTWINEETGPIFADCPWKQDIEDARAVAEKLNIPFEVVNLIEDYKQKIVEYLVQGYACGITPNPDIMCNREIKFGVFLKYALSQGFDAIATGHYTRLLQNPDKTYNIWEGTDKNKDQSYFLSLVHQAQLKHAYFPIGHLYKPQVREIAHAKGLPNANKKDSQGICFLGKVSINEFLAHYLPDKPGDIVRADGKLLGHHRGLHRYTLGQRKGIGIPSNADFEKYVVVSKNFEKNQLIVAFESKEAPGLYTTSLRIANIHWLNQPIADTKELLAKPRYRDPSQKILFKPIDNHTAEITFELSQRALASGQVLALYEDEKLLGGGFYL